METPEQRISRIREAARKRRELVQKETRLVKGIIDLLTPTIENMKEWEIDGLLSEIRSTISLRFRPFRTYGQAIEYRRK